MMQGVHATLQRTWRRLFPGEATDLVPAGDRTAAPPAGFTPAIAVAGLRRVLLVVLGFSFFTNVLNLALPLYVLQVFDRVILSRSADTLWALTAVMLGAVALYGFLEAVRGRILMAADRYLDEGLTPLITRERIERVAAGDRDVLRSGASDLRNLRAFFAGGPLTSMMDTVWSPIYILIVFLIHPALGVVGLIGALGLLALSVGNDILLSSPQKLANLYGMKGAEITDGAIRNAEAVSALGMTGALMRRIDEAAEVGRYNQRMASARAGTISSVTKVFRIVVQVALTGLGVYLVIYNNLSAGGVFAASLIMARGLAPFEQMQRTWATVVSARQSYRQLNEAFGRFRATRSAMTYPAPAGRLTVEAVSFVPPGAARPTLAGISFALEPGDALGVIGPSAAGKSTLARLLVGVWPPTAGRVRLDGIDVAQWSPDTLGRHVGYVPQAIELLAGTVRENIARFEPDATDAEVIAAATMANAHDLIVRLPKGYDTDIGEAGALLSGGQRQRVALARALFREPRLIVLDEPNSNLDAEGEAAMLEALQAAKARGATIVIVAHRPSLLAFVDKLAVIKDGRLDAFGERPVVMARMAPRPTVVPDVARLGG